MGIKGLAKLINENKARICTPTGPIGGELVVDGYTILHELYSVHGLDWANGGCYAQQYQVTVDYFKALVASGVRPIVVVDGGGSSDHLKDTLHRRNRNIEKLPNMIEEAHGKKQTSHIMPLMARDIFKSSLRENGIEMYVADGKATKTVVRLANYYRCPILSNNTNYCVCNVEGGVILFSHLDIKTCTATIYKQTKLVEFCRLSNPDLLYGVVAILGDGSDASVPNLYHGRIRGKINESLKGIDVNRRSWVMNITDYLRIKGLKSFIEFRQCRSLNFGGQLQSFLENCDRVERQYMEFCNPRNILSTEELCSSTEVRCSKPCDLPLPILRGFRNGTFPLLALDAMTTGECVLEQCVGDQDQPPTAMLGLPVRKLIYGLASSLMHRGEKTCINEYHRSMHGDLKYSAHPVFPSCKHSELMVSELYCNGDTAKRALAVLAMCEVLDCQETVVHGLEGSESDRALVLVTLVTRFWAKYLKQSQNVPNPDQVIKALVVNFFLNLSDPDTNRQPDIDLSRYSHPDWIKVYHALLEWLSLYRSVCSLNAILCEPFPLRSSCFLFDGPLIFFLALHESPEIIDTYRMRLTPQEKEQCKRVLDQVNL